jgi:putative MFS transporter
MTNTGNVVAYITAICLVGTGGQAWRWMLLVGAFLAVVVAYLRRTIPESPRWLVRQGRLEEARRIMLDVAGQDVDLSEFQQKKLPKLPWRRLFQGVLLKRTIFVLSFWFLFGASYYGVSMFSPQIVSSFAGTDRILTFVGSGIIAILGVCGALLGSVLVERWGRRTDIILGYGVMFVCMGTLACIENFGGGGDIPLFIVILLVGVNILAGQVGPGTLNLLYPNELFPTQLRGQAVGLGTAVSRIGSILGVLVFPRMIDAWGSAKALWLFVGLAGLGLLVCIFMAPETKGKSLEELNAETEGK